MPEFVLNPEKPYVYLQFDHVGPRKPLRAGEPPLDCGSESLTTPRADHRADVRSSLYLTSQNGAKTGTTGNTEAQQPKTGTTLTQ